MDINEVKKINEEYNFLRYINENAKGKFIVSIKDAICVKDMPSGAGSEIIEDYIPVFDATCIKKIKEAGGDIIGKANQDAFGFGSFCTNTKDIPLNPNDKTRVCGGSSGGNAGFTKLAENHIALGESTGGSIACPASFCGVVGLTPTYGRISRYGLIDYANSLDKIGPIGKTVKDCAFLLHVISGKDDKDCTSVDMPKDFLDDIDKPIKNFKIGIIQEGFGEGIDPIICKKIKNSVSGDEVNLPITFEYSLATYYLIAMAEASTNLAKYCGLRYGKESNPTDKSFNNYFSEIRSKYFEKETKRRIIMGTFARMAGFRDAYYLKALKVRTLIIEEFKKAFEKYDILVCPTMPIVAPTFKEAENLTPLQNYMMDILTVGPNLAGLPHISVPCGNKGGMPFGIMFIADHFNEKKLLQFAHNFEENYTH